MPSSSLTNNHAEVLVAGAGPVGAFTALILARNGIKITLVEANNSVDTSPRAMAFQPCALAEMVEAGVYDDIYEHSVKNAIISWWRAGLGSEKKHLATISTAEGKEPFLTGLNYPQSEFTRVVLKHLEREHNATVLFGHRVVDVVSSAAGEPAIVKIKRGNIPDSTETLELTASWVVGADGGKSVVRAATGIEFEGFTWPKEEFVATNVYYPFDQYGYTNRNFVVDSVNWAVVAKINNEGLWRVAYGTRPGLTDPEVREELPERFKYFLPGSAENYVVENISTYRPHQRCGAHLRKGQIILVGDAAHLNNPIGGLGLTTGILDAGPLARALSAVIKGKAPESLLDKWDELRRKTWWEQTNRQSIEFKRIAQQGGYGEDPYGIWDSDDVAEKHNMTAYLTNATLEAKKRDEALYEALKIPSNQRAARGRVWGLALPPDWMAEFEDEEFVERRRNLRPKDESNVS